MSSHKFELAKRDNPALADLLDRLIKYIERQIMSGQSFLLPKLAAASLGINDGEAYILLEVLAKYGVLERAFNVYCKQTGVLLMTAHDEGELSGLPHCDECDLAHDQQELRFELAFEPANSGGNARRAA